MIFSHVVAERVPLSIIGDDERDGPNKDERTIFAQYLSRDLIVGCRAAGVNRPLDAYAE